MSAPADTPLDPTAPMSPSLRRSTFVGIGTAAVAAATGNALAASDLGKPHVPLVAENDPSIVVFRPILTSATRSINSYAALPKDAPAGTPGVVMTMHIWGVDAQIRDTVRRLAKAGYVAIAPDLYSSFAPPSGDGTSEIDPFVALAKKLNPDEVHSDLASGAQWIRTRLPSAPGVQTKVGIIGFCMGGAIALRQTTRPPQTYDAASIFYGAVAGLDPKDVTVPAIGSYGERDTGIPAADVTAFYNATTVGHDLKIYPEAGHAFFDDTRKSYVASAAEDAWKRTLHWFSYYLAGKR